jgi:ribosomal protein L7/L12
MPQIQVFACPSCGASLTYEGGPEVTVECQFCGHRAPVPAELRARAEVTPPAAPMAPMTPPPVPAGSPLEAMVSSMMSSALGVSLDQLKELRQLAQAGEKEQAVLHFRQLFPHVSLEQAQDAVEKMASGQPVALDAGGAPASGKAGQPADLSEVERLARAGQKIDAIKLYRQISRVGLKEAKDTVDQMAGGGSAPLAPSAGAKPVRPSLRCLGAGCVSLVVIALFGLVFAWVNFPAIEFSSEVKTLPRATPTYAPTVVPATAVPTENVQADDATQGAEAKATKAAAMTQTAEAPRPTVPFAGGASLRVFYDQGLAWVSAEVCADNLPGQVVTVILSRPGRAWDPETQISTGRCVTFWNLDGQGDVHQNAAYTVQAAIAAPPDVQWPAPCYAATGGLGLCAQAQYPDIGADGAEPIASPMPVTPVPFTGNASLRMYFDQGLARLNAEVCADNLPGKAVTIIAARAGREWTPMALMATERCVTFEDLDGAGDVLEDKTYKVWATLQAEPEMQWPVPCYAATNGLGLCAQAQYPNVGTDGAAPKP